MSSAKNKFILVLLNYSKRGDSYRVVNRLKKKCLQQQ